MSFRTILSKKRRPPFPDGQSRLSNDGLGEACEEALPAGQSLHHEPRGARLRDLAQTCVQLWKPHLPLRYLTAATSEQTESLSTRGRGRPPYDWTPVRCMALVRLVTKLDLEALYLHVALEEPDFKPRKDACRDQCLKLFHCTAEQARLRWPNGKTPRGDDIEKVFKLYRKQQKFLEHNSRAPDDDSSASQSTQLTSHAFLQARDSILTPPKSPGTASMNDSIDTQIAPLKMSSLPTPEESGAVSSIYESSEVVRQAASDKLHGKTNAKRPPPKNRQDCADRLGMTLERLNYIMYGKVNPDFTSHKPRVGGALRNSPNGSNRNSLRDSFLSRASSLSRSSKLFSRDIPTTFFPTGQVSQHPPTIDVVEPVPLLCRTLMQVYNEGGDFNNLGIEIARLITEEGADTHATDGSGLTALHIAAAMGCQPAVYVLLGAGAHTNVKTKAGETVSAYSRRFRDKRLDPSHIAHVERVREQIKYDSELQYGFKGSTRASAQITSKRPKVGHASGSSDLLPTIPAARPLVVEGLNSEPGRSPLKKKARVKDVSLGMQRNSTTEIHQSFSPNPNGPPQLDYPTTLGGVYQQHSNWANLAPGPAPLPSTVPGPPTFGTVPYIQNHAYSNSVIRGHLTDAGDGQYTSASGASVPPALLHSPDIGYGSMPGSIGEVSEVAKMQYRPAKLGDRNKRPQRYTPHTAPNDRRAFNRNPPCTHRDPANFTMPLGDIQNSVSPLDPRFSLVNGGSPNGTFWYPPQAHQGYGGGIPLSTVPIVPSNGSTVRTGHANQSYTANATQYSQSMPSLAVTHGAGSQTPQRLQLLPGFDYSPFTHGNSFP